MKPTLLASFLIVLGLFGSNPKAQDESDSILTLADLELMLEIGQDEARILREVQAADALAVSTHDLEELRAKGASGALLAAIEARLATSAASVVEQILRMKAEGAGEDQILRWILRNRVSCEMSMSELKRLRSHGVSAETLKALSGTYVVPGYKVYQDPLGILSFQHPATWTTKEWYTGNGYNVLVSPEASASELDDFTLGFQVQVSVVPKGTMAGGVDVLELYARELPGLLQRNHALDPEPVSTARMVELRGVAALEQDFHVTMLGVRCRELLLRAIDEDLQYFMEFVAPLQSYPQYEPAFENILATLRTLPNKVALARNDVALLPSEAMDRYRAAVVQVRTDVGTGTGFFVREDGWVLTNAHVVCDPSSREVRPVTTLTYTDSETGERAEVAAKVVDRVWSEVPRIDMALLKVPRGRVPYPVIPVSPVGAGLNREGDPIVAMGYAGIGDGSLLLTQGVLTAIRYVERSVADTSHRTLDDLLTDATIAPGNSGGPCINLRTGGVVGLNTYIPLGDRGERYNYSGVSVIDHAIAEFPQLRWYPRTSTVRAEQHLEIGGMLLSTGRLRAAELELRLALEGESDLDLAQRARLCWLLACAQQRKGDMAGFRDWRERCLALDRNFVEAAASLSYELGRDGRMAEAVSIVDRLAQREPHSWYPAYVAAELYRVADRPADALGSLERARRLAGGSEPDVLVLAGRIEMDLGDFTAARKSFGQALTVDPTCLGARLAVAESFEREGQPGAASIEYARVVAEHPASPTAHAAHARFLRTGPGRDADAFEAFCQAIVLGLDGNELDPSWVQEACTLAARLSGQQATGVVLAQLLYERWPAWRGEAHAQLASLWETLGSPTLRSLHYACVATGSAERDAPPLLTEQDLVLVASVGYSTELLSDILGVTSLGFNLDGETLQRLAQAIPRLEVLEQVLLRFLADQMSDSASLGAAVRMEMGDSVEQDARGPFVPCTFTNQSGVPLTAMVVRKLYYDANRELIGETEGLLVTRDPSLAPGRDRTLSFRFNTWKELEGMGIRERVAYYGLEMVSARNATFLTSVQVMGSETTSGYALTLVNSSLFTVEGLSVRCDYVFADGSPVINAARLPVAAFEDLGGLVLGPGESSAPVELDAWADPVFLRGLGANVPPGREVFLRPCLLHARLRL